MRTNKTELFLEINGRQEKHKISPVGDVKGLDGRSYLIDGAAVVEYTRNQKLDIYLDENHDGGKAKGWYTLNTLEARGDGIYASVEYTEEGKQLVDSRAYRYLSPTYVMGDGRNVLGIGSVALVNTPNLLSKAINNQGGTGMTREDVKVMLEELKAEIVAEVLAEIKAASEDVQKVKEEILEGNKQRRIERIEEAVAAGRVSANKREFALSLDSGQFEQFLSVSAIEGSHLRKPANIEKNSKRHEDEVTALINKQLGI